MVHVASPQPRSALETAGADTLTGQLLRDTESGQQAFTEMQKRIQAMTEMRRQARLAKEADMAKNGVPIEEQRRRATLPITRPAKSYGPRTDAQDAAVQSYGSREQRADVKQWRPNGAKQGQARGGQGGKRVRRDRQRERRQREEEAEEISAAELDKYLMGLTRESALRELTTLGPAEFFIDAGSLPPNSVTPTVSNTLSSVFHPKPKPLEIVEARGVPPSLAPALVKSLGGDYAPSVPRATPNVYTTPVSQLPIDIQLQLVTAKATGLKDHQRQRMLEIVTNFVSTSQASA